MEQTLNADTGRAPGSRNAGRLRTEGKVPGVVYGLGREAVAVAVDWPELRRALTTEAGTNALINLRYDGDEDLTIVKDLQRDPVRREVVHVDFLRVDRNVTVEVEVPIVLVGEAKEVENARGIAEHSMTVLVVKTKPGNIPDRLEVDITNLTVGTSITVSEVALPPGVETDVDPDAAVVSGVATRFSEAEEAAEGEVLEGEEGAEGEGAEGGEGEGGAEAAEGGGG